MCSNEDGLWWILIKSGVYVTFPHQCHHPPQPCLRIINSLSTANILTKYSKQRLNEKWVAACLQSLTYIVCSVNWIQTGTLYFNPHFSTFMSPPVRAAQTWECSNFACVEQCWLKIICFLPLLIIHSSHLHWVLLVHSGGETMLLNNSLMEVCWWLYHIPSPQKCVKQQY